MNIFQILVLRSSVEKLFNDLNLPADRKTGTIDNIKWFLKNGYRQNRFKSTFSTNWFLRFFISFKTLLFISLF